MDFENLYQKLNKDQKDAVDTLDGPVMVIAGPGTGKTQVLTLRIANILKKTDTPASAILALTFTESSANSMRDRLSKIIGKDAYLVNINTFHSFAASIIAENPDVFLMGEDFDILSDIERLSVIHKILDTEDLEYLNPSGDPYFYSYYISSSISTLKREGITYKAYKELVSLNKELIENINNKEKRTAADLNEIKKLGKQLELKKLYKAYQKELKKIKRYDFEDLINFVNDAFKTNETLLRTYQERFLYILVDEFQDTNNSQYKLLSNLTSFWGIDSDIFVVGDDDQSIFRFQGASVENMLLFLKDFPNAKIVNLVNNYRSTQLILDSAREVITNNKISIVSELGTITKKLQSNKKLPKDPKIRHYTFSNGIFEANYVASKIKKLLKSGVSPKEIAVIYRNNSDSSDIETALSKKEVLYNIEGGGNVLESEDVKKFLKLLYVIEKSKNKDEDIDLFTLLNYEFLGFDYVENLKLSRFATSKKINFIEAILRINEDKDIKEPDKYVKFLKKISEWQNVDAENNFLKTFEVILNDSGYLQYILNSKNSLSSINKINSLYTEVHKLCRNKREYKIKDFLKAIDIYLKNNLKIYETDFDVDRNAVTLTTCHKAKGLEFEYVFIYKFLDKKWGNTRNIEFIKLPEGIVKLTTTDANEDERRLFYVAITRAKKRIYLTSSKTYSTDYGKSSGEPGMFLLELPPKNIFTVDTEKIETKKFIEKSASLFLSTNNDSTKVEANEKQVLDYFLADFKLSVTALETYLTCPYKFKLNNILRTPRSKAPYLAMGTAVHRALEDYYRNLITTGKLESSDFICASYEQALNKEMLTEREHKVLLIKGKKVLNAYLSSYKQEFKKPEYLERLFGYGFGKIYVGDNIPLVGKVDRVELLKTEGNEKHVKIVDYKTGKIKSLNEIEGNTQNSTGSLKRQLVFYKLLCDLDRTFRYKATTFELDFIGNGTDGEKCKKYSFEITEEEVETLKKLIIETMQKIRSYEFPRITDPSICNNCEYIDHCYPNGIPKVAFKQGELEF